MKAIHVFCFLLGALTCGGASADRGGHHGGHRGGVGVVLDVPLFWPWYYPSSYYNDPYPYYPYRPIIVEPSGPVTYIEKREAPTAAETPDERERPQINYWYYCNKPDGYYPYVKQCPGGWKMVPTQPTALPPPPPPSHSQ